MGKNFPCKCGSDLAFVSQTFDCHFLCTFLIHGPVRCWNYTETSLVPVESQFTEYVMDLQLGDKELEGKG